MNLTKFNEQTDAYEAAQREAKQAQPGSNFAKHLGEVAETRRIPLVGALKDSKVEFWQWLQPAQAAAIEALAKVMGFKNGAEADRQLDLIRIPVLKPFFAAKSLTRRDFPEHGEPLIATCRAFIAGVDRAEAQCGKPDTSQCQCSNGEK